LTFNIQSTRLKAFSLGQEFHDKLLGAFGESIKINNPKLSEEDYLVTRCCRELKKFQSIMEYWETFRIQGLVLTPEKNSSIPAERRQYRMEGLFEWLSFLQLDTLTKTHRFERKMSDIVDASENFIEKKEMQEQAIKQENRLIQTVNSIFSSQA
jgi:hypothetical protein